MSAISLWHIYPIDPASESTRASVLLRFFNSLGVSSEGPQRIHPRITLFSRFNLLGRSSVSYLWHLVNWSWCIDDRYLWNLRFPATVWFRRTVLCLEWSSRNMIVYMSKSFHEWLTSLFAFQEFPLLVGSHPSIHYRLPTIRKPANHECGSLSTSHPNCSRNSVIRCPHCWYMAVLFTITMSALVSFTICGSNA